MSVNQIGYVGYLKIHNYSQSSLITFQVVTDFKILASQLLGILAHFEVGLPVFPIDFIKLLRE